MNTFESIMKIAQEERRKTIQLYGSTAGRCIDTSDRILERIQNELHLRATGKQVWVLYENFENCMECCYEEHWITKVLIKGYPYYIDATMDQFQWAFSRKLPEVYINRRLPNFYLVKEPGKVTLDKCGWNDWYNYGNYINNFNYWEK